MSARFASAQRYSFKNYDIADGLIQSQAQRIYQDRDHSLWISTLGGLSKFNGRDFVNFDGIRNLQGAVTSMMQDGAGNMWFAGGELLCYNGTAFKTLSRPAGHEGDYYHHLVSTRDGKLWGIIGFKLFRIDKNVIQTVDLPEGTYVDALETDRYGNLYASFRGRGLFLREDEDWKNIIDYTGAYKDIIVRRVLFDRVDSNRVYLQSFEGLYRSQDGRLTEYPNPDVRQIRGSHLSLRQDSSGSLWVCTSAGLYNFNEVYFRSFSSVNGFTDNAVNDITIDNAGNVWLATEGSGIFRFNGDMYVRFDQTQGLPNEVIMSLAGNEKEGIWMGTFGGGLIRYHQNKLSFYKIPSGGPRAQSIFSLAMDRKGTLWIGTLLDGIWQYKNGRFSHLPTGQHSPRLINGLLEDRSGAVWISSAQGCFYHINGATHSVPGYEKHAYSLAEIGRDSMLVGNESGVDLVVGKKLSTTFRLPMLRGKGVLSMRKYGDLVFFTTAGEGLYIWNMRTHKIRRAGVSEGLFSDYIYSITSDGKSYWIGTGRGINKINVDPLRLSLTVLNDHSPTRLVVEANQNSALFDGRRIWVGTAKGAMVYDPARTFRFTKPAVKILAVHASRPGTGNDAAETKGMQLLSTDSTHNISFGRNNLLITYGGTYLSDQEALRYQYRLAGLENTFSAPVKGTAVNYLSIPAGTYTFEVKAVLENGLSSDISKFSFVIVPPFYRTGMFRFLVFVLLVLAVILIQHYLNIRKEKRRLLIQSITQEEQRKIREQTAEDFHDDMGNKLTRISILSDILSAKIEPAKSEERKLVSQIKDTASALYNGTKDILWALDPKADNLFEIMTHLKYFGTDLFSNTGVEFRFEEPESTLQKIRLPMEYSRNITMIVKELLNNILKHADSSYAQVWVSVEGSGITIGVADDGRGFDTAQSYSGKGMLNIRNRAKRIKGSVHIISESSGTTTTLFFNKPA